MEMLRERFGDDFIRVMKDFCESVTVAAQDVARIIVEIGDAIDCKLGNDVGTAASHIIYILDKNEKLRNFAQKLISLYGLDGLRMFYANLFPASLYNGRTFFLIKEYHTEYIPYIIDPKPYKGYCDHKHRLPCKPIHGYKRPNQWMRTRSNPKLR